MTWMEAYNYASQVEAARDREIYLRDMEQAQYESECLLNLKALLKEFEEIKKEYSYLFSEPMWELIESEIEDVTPYTTLSEIMKNYMSDGRMWEDWEKLNPGYTDEQEAEFDRNSDIFYDLF